jgi:hypothetical protein
MYTIELKGVDIPLAKALYLEKVLSQVLFLYSSPHMKFTYECSQPNEPDSGGKAAYYWKRRFFGYFLGIFNQKGTLGLHFTF